MTITEYLINITERGYKITINPDFEGTFRIDFMEYDDDGFVLNPNSYYKHSHLAYPGAKPDEVEKAFRECLAKFLAEDV